MLDFRKATNHFADPDFDGEPVQIYEPGEYDPVTPLDNVRPADDGDEVVPPKPGDDQQIVVDPLSLDINITSGFEHP